MLARAAILPAQAPGGVHDILGVDMHILAGAQIFADRACHALLALDRFDIMVGQHLRAMLPGVLGVRARRQERVGRSVADGEGAADARVEQRLALERLAHGDLADRHLGILAALEEALGVGLIVGGGDDEKTAGVLEAVRHDPAQDLVLDGALGGRLRVLDDIAPAAVQQPVVAPAGAVGQVALLHQHGADAAQRQVAQDAHARRAAADDQHISRDLSHRNASIVLRTRLGSSACL